VVGLGLFEGRLAIGNDHNVEAGPLKEGSQAIHDIRIVIGKQDKRVWAGHPQGLEKGLVARARPSIQTKFQ
jgi:hypothetical protein